MTEPLPTVRLIILAEMKIIGLTGGIGTGKSTVSCFLAEMGAAVIDADRVGHEVFKPHTPTWREVVAAFGEEILKPDGEVDRRKLGEIVFTNRDARERLNRIMHGQIYEMVKARLEEYQRQGVSVVVIEAPLLVEAGWAPFVDEVWVTVAPEPVVLSRIKGRDNLSESETMARIRSQLPAGERIKHAQVIIDTNCSLDQLKARVRELWEASEPGKSTHA